MIDNALPDAYLREFAKEFPEVSLSEGQAKHGFGRCYLPGEHKKCSLADNGITIMETPYAHGLFSLLLSQAAVHGPALYRTVSSLRNYSPHAVLSAGVHAASLGAAPGAG